MTCLSHDEGLVEAGRTIFFLVASNSGDRAATSLSLSVKEGETLAECWAFQASELPHTGYPASLMETEVLAFILTHFLSSYLLISFKTEASTLNSPGASLPLKPTLAFFFIRTKHPFTAGVSPDPPHGLCQHTHSPPFLPSPEPGCLGDNEPLVRPGGQLCPGWSLGTSARWPPLPWPS